MNDTVANYLSALSGSDGPIVGSPGVHDIFGPFDDVVRHHFDVISWAMTQNTISRRYRSDQALVWC